MAAASGPILHGLAPFEPRCCFGWCWPGWLGASEVDVRVTGSGASSSSARLHYLDPPRRRLPWSTCKFDYANKGKSAIIRRVRGCLAYSSQMAHCSHSWYALALLVCSSSVRGAASMAEAMLRSTSSSKLGGLLSLWVRSWTCVSLCPPIP